MSNTLLTPQIITNEALMLFMNNLRFASTSTHEYDAQFNKIGDTLKLRDNARFIVNDGSDITSSIQDVTESSVSLTIDKQKNVAFQFSAKDRTLTIDRFADRYLKDPMIKLANQVDVDGLTKAYQSCPNAVGTPGTTPASLRTYLQAGQKLNDAACPKDNDRYVVFNPKMEVELVDANKGLFQSSTAIGNSYVNGEVGTAAGFRFLMDQNVRTHTVGAYVGTPLVNDTVASGDTDVTTDGWTGSVTGLLKKGDIVTFAGVYDVNPVSGDTLADLKQFVVTSDVNSSGGAATIPVYPAFISSGAFKTCSALPADNAAITVLGSASTASPQGLAYHKYAMTWATAQLEMPEGVHLGARATDPETGISIRMVSFWNGLTDVFVTRCDILYGWAVRRPTWMCRIAS